MRRATLIFCRDNHTSVQEVLGMSYTDFELWLRASERLNKEIAKANKAR